MLINEHTNADTTHQESIQKVLNVLLGFSVNSVGLLHLQNAHGHVLHYVGVSVHYVVECLVKSGSK